MDAIELLTQQHREVDAAFDEYLRLADGDDERRKGIARKVITDLSVHAGIEEVAFYPTVREALPDMEDEIEDDLEEHKEAKEILSDIQGMDPDDAEFDAKFRELIQDVRHHVDDEENELFPRVRQALADDELRELGSHMQDLMGKVPTNPHPHAPQEPPANQVAGPMAGALDRLRDRIRERMDKDSV